MSKTKFKVGDKVILTKKVKKWFIDRGYEIDPNKTYTILEIPNFRGETYRLKGIHSIQFFDDDLELYDEGVLSTKNVTTHRT